MFDQMKQLKQLAGMLGNAGELKARFEAVQADLEQKTAEGDAGAGAVRVTVNGRLRVVAVHLDPAVLATLTPPDGGPDHPQVEELILTATNAALDRAQAMVQAEMASLTGGMNLPGMDQLMGG
ncbi:MAG: YbaB/EbfC family nucleoid-associated protein [Planctomycetota bacterium]